jgi:hypothetical protein
MLESGHTRLSTASKEEALAENLPSLSARLRDQPGPAESSRRRSDAATENATFARQSAW